MGSMQMIFDSGVGAQTQRKAVFKKLGITMGHLMILICLHLSVSLVTVYRLEEREHREQ